MSEYVAVLTPVLWAIVSTVIGLLLYRTSEAVFQKNQKSKGTTTKLRLVGSVTIAAVAFYGLYLVTPRDSLARIPPDTRLVPGNDLRALRSATYDANRSALEVESCIATVPESCAAEVNRLRQHTSRADEIAGKLLGNRAGSADSLKK